MLQLTHVFGDPHLMHECIAGVRAVQVLASAAGMAALEVHQAACPATDSLQLSQR